MGLRVERERTRSVFFKSLLLVRLDDFTGLYSSSALLSRRLTVARRVLAFFLFDDRISSRVSSDSGGEVSSATLLVCVKLARMLFALFPLESIDRRCAKRILPALFSNTPFSALHEKRFFRLLETFQCTHCSSKLGGVTIVDDNEHAREINECTVAYPFETVA